LKAQVLNMQWMSLSLTGDAGSNASMFTSSNMWLTAFNAGMNGGARAIGEQLASQLRRYNSGSFGEIKKLPVLRATPVEANIDLLELAQFVQGVFPSLDVTPEDWAAIRRKSNFLPEIEPSEIVEDDEVNEPDDDAPEGDAEQPDDEMPDEETADGDGAELAMPIAIGEGQPTVTTEEDLLDLDDPEELKRLLRRLERADPFLADLFDADEGD